MQLNTFKCVSSRVLCGIHGSSTPQVKMRGDKGRYGSLLRIWGPRYGEIRGDMDLCSASGVRCRVEQRAPDAAAVENKVAVGRHCERAHRPRLHFEHRTLAEPLHKPA